MITKICSDLEQFILDKCRDQGCRLKGIPGTHIILDGDELLKTVKSCDCIIFEDPYNHEVVLVECKSSMQSVSAIEQKFQNSSDFVKEIIDKYCENPLGPELYCILLTKGGGIRPTDMKKLHKVRIRCYNRYFNIDPYHSGCFYHEIK